MFFALFYLQFHSFKNRTIMRLKRLRQPKYLAGAIVGGAYFWFYFFRPLVGAGTGRPAAGRELLVAYPDFWLLAGGAALLVMVLLAWLLPHERAALRFSEAEVAFLFPAPISRRGLIHYKLLRSQVAIFFTVLLLTLVTNRLGGRTWTQAAGWWLLLSTLNLHFLGSSFARTLLLDRGIGNWQRRLWILVPVVLAGGTLVLGTRNLPPLDITHLSSMRDANEYARSLNACAPLNWVLLPFQIVIRPYLAADAMQFLRALGPAVLLLGLHYIWVVRSNVGFEEASLEAARKTAEKITAVRAGNWQAASGKIKSRRPPFSLRPVGPAFVALFWKNLISAGQVATLRVWISLGVFSVVVGIGIGSSGSGATLAGIGGVIAAAALAWSLLVGPQVFRQDFRQDLPSADVLKAFPLPGWQLALGELLAPAVILTGIQWFLLVLACGLLKSSTKLPLPAAEAFCGCAGAILLVPFVNLSMLIIPNAAVLLFPAWFASGKDAPHGIEATGQRIIFFLGQVLVLMIAWLPVGLAVGLVLLVGRVLVGLSAALLLAALAGAVVMAGETTLGLLWLGRLFTRLDISQEHSAQ